MCGCGDIYLYTSFVCVFMYVCHIIYIFYNDVMMIKK